jgi:hypothetical protein
MGCWILHTGSDEIEEFIGAISMRHFQMCATFVLQSRKLFHATRMLQSRRHQAEMTGNGTGLQMYYSLRDFLTPAQVSSFFNVPHSTQIDLVAQYLDYLKTREIPQSSSRKRSICTLSPLVPSTSLPPSLGSLCTLSGFGATGTDPTFLPQHSLSLSVARVCGEISHRYRVEGGTTPVLNSRSFYLYWCHAEKQLLIHLRQTNIWQQSEQWNDMYLSIDREMCPDCIAFAQTLAQYDNLTIRIQDPLCMRVFRGDGRIGVESRVG